MLKIKAGAAEINSLKVCSVQEITITYLTATK